MIELRDCNEFYEEFLRKLENDEPFAFSRFGDGEFNCIFGKTVGGQPGKNCDGHTYFTDLGMRLLGVLRSNPTYYVGIQPLALKTQYSLETVKLLTGLRKNDWINADVLHKASIKHDLKRFFAILETKSTLTVGPDHVFNLKMSGFHINIPYENCWNEYENIRKYLTEYLLQYDGLKVLFCAGMMSNVLIDDMHREFGKKHTLIDCGSVFDPYCGVNSRSYHHNLQVYDTN